MTDDMFSTPEQQISEPLPPSWLPPNWGEFVEMRLSKGKRAPFTEAARKSILKKLGSLYAQGYDIEAILQESIDNGWSGVFQPKGPPPQNKPDSFKFQEGIEEKKVKRPHPSAHETKEYLKQRAEHNAKAIKGEEAKKRIQAIKDRLGIKK